MSTTFGPFAFATSQLIFILACITVWVIGWLFSRRQRVALGDALFRIIAIGLISARIGFVIKYVDIYLASPWQVINVRDGGFLLWVGLVAGAAWTWREWRVLAKQSATVDQAPRGAQLGLVGALAFGFCVAAVGNLWLHHNISQTQLPQLTLTSSEGQRVQTAHAFYGQPVVINLWASWCPPCVREMPILEQAAEDWPDVHIVAVNQGESSALVNQFLQQQGLTLPLVLLDEQSQMGSLVGSQALPTTLFFNSDGSLSYTHIGEFSAATLENALRRLD